MKFAKLGGSEEEEDHNNQRRKSKQFRRRMVSLLVSQAYLRIYSPPCMQPSQLVVPLQNVPSTTGPSRLVKSKLPPGYTHPCVAMINAESPHNACVSVGW